LKQIQLFPKVIVLRKNYSKRIVQVNLLSTVFCDYVSTAIFHSVSDARKHFYYWVKQVGKGELPAEQKRNRRCFVTIYGKDEKIQPCRCHLLEMKILISN
jgi:hypothetical protein